MEGKLHLEVDDSVSQMVMSPHRVPVALKGKFKEGIDRLIDVGVLTKVEELTKWLASAVVCINPRPLNTRHSIEVTTPYL